MVVIIILALLLFISFGILLFFFVQKYPQIRMISPESSTEVRDKRKKKEILRGRLERMSGAYLVKLKGVALDPVGRLAQNIVRTVAGRLTAAERIYKEKQKKQQALDITPEQIAEWVGEGEKLFEEEEFEKAEKKLIDVIGFDSRCVDAYELLGQIYLKRKDYQLAEETFAFLVKLAPKDASVQAYMGEVFEARDQMDKALPYYEKAVELSSRNPRYLDFFISAAIDVKEKDLAEKGLLLLEEANPDNQKIEAFRSKIKDLA